MTGVCREGAKVLPERERKCSRRVGESGKSWREKELPPDLRRQQVQGMSTSVPHRKQRVF
jgi:hypothetical protein